MLSTENAYDLLIQFNVFPPFERILMWSRHGGGIENIGKYGGKPVHFQPC